MYFICDYHVGIVGDELFTGAEFHGQAKPLAAVAVQPGFEADLPALHVRRPSHAADVSRGDAFHPHRLPDARGARGPDAVRLELPVLLAARLGKIGRVVLRAYHDRLRIFEFQKSGDLAAEWRVAALMFRRRMTVDPDGGAIIHGREMKHQAIPWI